MQVSPQSKSLFNYYNFYKFVIGLLLLGIAFTQKGLLEQYREPELFQHLTIGYLALNAFILLSFRFSSYIGSLRIFAVIAFDITFLHLLFYCGSGIAGGLANLIIISVAAGNIIIRGKIGLSFAALATVLTFIIEGERYFLALNELSDIARTGLVGIMYFASAYILQYLAVRISQSEQLLKEQERDLRELEKLNHQIIQSMRTGIIVCDSEENVILHNNACQDLLAFSDTRTLPDYLSERVKLWKSKPDIRTTPFRANQDKPLVQANFAQLKKERGTDTLIFLEDTRKMTQQAQQLKLASLGRLTASIAHEVRNPLGAISHATQLLAESENLDRADQKMTDIIQRHSQRVNQIIENILTLSRRSEPNIQEIKLNDWLEKIVSDYNFQSSEHNIKLMISSDDIYARFDPDQIEQVLINLIDNGIRHSQKVSSAHSVFVLLSETADKGRAYIDVIDQGEGVPEENLMNLFEPFFTTETTGTGLGLYLSRELCEANQAHLDYIPAQSIGHEPLKTALAEEDLSSVGACFRILFAHHKRII